MIIKIEKQRVNGKREKTIKRPSVPGDQARARILSIVFCSYFISNTKELQEGKFPKRKTVVCIQSAEVQFLLERENNSILTHTILRENRNVNKKNHSSSAVRRGTIPHGGEEKQWLSCLENNKGKRICQIITKNRWEYNYGTQLSTPGHSYFTSTFLLLFYL